MSTKGNARSGAARARSGGARELAFTVTKDKFKITTFTAGGPGGQHQNHSNTAVRITHPDSGASAECRMFRSQHQNKMRAFKNLVNSGKFRVWVNRQLLKNPLPPEEQVQKDMAPENLLILGMEEGIDGTSRWRIIE